MARRRSRARERRRRKEILAGVAIFCVVIAIFVAAGWFVLSREPGLDKLTLCPAKGPVGHVVLLVDRTDPFNFTQKQAFIRRVDELVLQDLKPGELLSVFVLGENYRDTPKPVFEMCRPGDGAEQDPLTGNPQRQEDRFRRQFREPMLAVADSLLAAEAAHASPILEMLQMVSINGFRRHTVKGSKRLILVSDMLHNTSEFSLYQAPQPDYAAFAKTPYATKTQTRLDDVEVELDYLMNRPKLQTRRQLKFWEDLFANYGARIVKVWPLEG